MRIITCIITICMLGAFANAWAALDHSDCIVEGGRYVNDVCYVNGKQKAGLMFWVRCR